MTGSSGSTLPSRTSILVAAARAFGSRDPDPGVRNPDFLADQLIGKDELDLIRDHPLSGGMGQEYAAASQVPTIALFVSLMILRTRYIDAALQRAVEAGATQVVILGAGFDSRAYRFQQCLRHCRVIEVDARATQEHKRRRASLVLGQEPPNLAYVALDFEADDLLSALLQAGFRKGDRSLFLWEGVSMYLPEASVRRTLQTIAAISAAGSSVVLDYANSLGIELAQRSSPGPVALAAAWGEPWIFGVPGDTGEQFFRELGFDPGVPLSLNSPEVMRQFAVRADGSTYAARVVEKLKTEAKLGLRHGERPPTAAAAAQKAIAAAGGVYWIAELTVAPKGTPT